jgi:hypothetical protein
MRLRAFHIGCILAVVILLVGGCGVVMLAASSLPSGELPEVDFRGAEISTDRAAIVPELDAQLDGVERRFGAEHVGPRWRSDRCEEGQDNFTRTDGYAYSCRMQIAQLMPVGEPFSQNASRLGEALLAGDCPGGTDTDRALAEPYHSRPEQIDGSSGDCTQGYREPGPEIRHWFARSASDDELETARNYLGARCDWIDARDHCETSQIDLRAAVDAAPSNAAYLAIVVADDEYHSIPWDCPFPASWVRDSCRS